MKVTITSLAECMDLHVNKLTAAVNSLSSATSNNLGKDKQDQCICKNPEHSDNLETGEIDKVLNICEDEMTLYQEQKRNYGKGFPWNSENDFIFSAAIKGFSDSYNVDDKK